MPLTWWEASHASRQNFACRKPTQPGLWTYAPTAVLHSLLSDAPGVRKPGDYFYVNFSTSEPLGSIIQARAPNISECLQSLSKDLPLLRAQAYTLPYGATGRLDCLVYLFAGEYSSPEGREWLIRSLTSTPCCKGPKTRSLPPCGLLKPTNSTCPQDRQDISSNARWAEFNRAFTFDPSYLSYLLQVQLYICKMFYFIFWESYSNKVLGLSLLSYYQNPNWDCIITNNYSLCKVTKGNNHLLFLTNQLLFPQYPFLCNPHLQSIFD